MVLPRNIKRLTVYEENSGDVSVCYPDFGDEILVIDYGSNLITYRVHTKNGFGEVKHIVTTDWNNKVVSAPYF